MKTGGTYGLIYLDTKVPIAPIIWFKAQWIEKVLMNDRHGFKLVVVQKIKSPLWISYQIINS